MSDGWRGQGSGLEENAASSSQLTRRQFNLVHSPALTQMRSKSLSEYGAVSLTWAHYTDKPSMNLKVVLKHCME